MIKKSMQSLVAAGALAASLMAAEPTKKIEVHGHRGARAMRPENTLPAFEYAIGIGVDVLELDMAVTKDNVVVISHDPILRAPVCSPPASFKGSMAVIHQLTLAEVREWDCGKVRNPEFATQTPVPGTKMPTLDEVFQLAAKSKVKFNIETKITAERTTKERAEAMVVRLGLAPGSEAAKNAVDAMMAIGPDSAPSPEDFVKLVLAKIRQYHVADRIILQSFDFQDQVAKPGAGRNLDQHIILLGLKPLAGQFLVAGNAGLALLPASFGGTANPLQFMGEDFLPLAFLFLRLTQEFGFLLEP